MQHVLMKWDGSSGGSDFQFAFLKFSFGISLLRRQSLLCGLIYVCLYCTKIACLPYVFQLPEFTVFSTDENTQPPTFLCTCISVNA